MGSAQQTFPSVAGIHVASYDTSQPDVTVMRFAIIKLGPQRQGHDKLDQVGLASNPSFFKYPQEMRLDRAACQAQPLRDCAWRISFNDELDDLNSAGVRP